jgi:hypothetical protein
MEVRSMAITIRAHFDGAVIVPDEPVDLPIGEPLELELRRPPSNEENPVDAAVIEERLRRLAAGSGTISGPGLPDEALRRENLYKERV